DIIVGQEELAHAGTVQSRTGTNSGCLQSRRFRNGIRVERRRFERFVTLPKPTTDHFMRVGFACNPVCPSRSGARRPEKRETARSKLPQKKWTGLHLPMNEHRQFVSASCTRDSTFRQRSTYVGS